MRDPEHRHEPRYRSGIAKTYANDRIEVKWEPDYCIHVAACLEGLPEVFDAWRRPWIEVDKASADEIAEVVQRCPTGALHFRRLDGGPQEAEAQETTVTEEPDGPLFVRGKVRVVAEDREVIREDTRVAFCRCGSSHNKPFCDGTHRVIGFRTTPTGE
jgi:uncharacterized Fe-S cluster protein YjdI/CDGSH-type Zn-finger protein